MVKENKLVRGLIRGLLGIAIMYLSTSDWFISFITKAFSSIR